MNKLNDILSEKIPLSIKEKLFCFFEKQKLDIRFHNDGRWIDQKCTPDVVLFIADCILEYTEHSLQVEFTKDDIWNSSYFNENVKAFFSKPDAKEITAIHEYDKFTAQPIKMLARSGVLSEFKRGNKNFYTIHSLEMLVFISSSEKNSLFFIYAYIMITFSQSGFINNILSFIQNNTPEEYKNIKSNFARLLHKNTRINGDTEANRIFIKVINPIAFMHDICGTIRGRISKFNILFGDLMYNRINFRDLDKAKNVTRKQHKHNLINDYYERDGDFGIPKVYSTYLVKQLVKSYHKYISEIPDEWSNAKATHAHHIFMKNGFPKIANHKENIISLTPTQHYNKAHPNNNTHIIDSQYQEICLMHKLLSVEKSITAKDNFYSLDLYIEVVNIGKPSTQLNSNDNPDTIRKKIALAYRASM